MLKGMWIEPSVCVLFGKAAAKVMVDVEIDSDDTLLSLLRKGGVNKPKKNIRPVLSCNVGELLRSRLVQKAEQ